MLSKSEKKARRNELKTETRHIVPPETALENLTKNKPEERNLPTQQEKRSPSSDEHLLVLDCPGLLFPQPETPHFVLELFGLLPIAQIREPYSAVNFLMQRLDLGKTYGGLKRPEWADAGEWWTAGLLLEALAEKRGYVGRNGVPDLHRAGLEVIRDCVEGALVVGMEAPAC